MKLRLVTLLTPLALAALVGSSAQATMIAGWDFSQYLGDGFMSTDDGSTFTNTLDANYSDVVPSPGAGPTAAPFGTMYVNGLFGSTNVNAGSGTEQFVPSVVLPDGSLASNVTAPLFNDFNSLGVLQSEGQANQVSLAMIAAQTSVVVFEADLSPQNKVGSDWSLSFAAKMTGGTSNLGIEFSSDGVSFSALPSVALNTVDTAFNVTLGPASTSKAYVRLTFNPSGSNQPLIDNVAFNAANVELPEPGAAVLGSLGLLGLVFAGRRRSPRH